MVFIRSNFAHFFLNPEHFFYFLSIETCTCLTHEFPCSLHWANLAAGSTESFPAVDRESSVGVSFREGVWGSLVSPRGEGWTVTVELMVELAWVGWGKVSRRESAGSSVRTPWTVASWEAVAWITLSFQFLPYRPSRCLETLKMRPC